MLILGNTKQVDALELLLNAGLAWSVRKEATQTITGIALPDHVAIVREDNDAILGVHKSGYTVFQNQQMAELICDLAVRENTPIHKAGSFNGGAKVYIQIKGENLRLGSDMIEGFFTIVNSFDGSTALGIGKATNTISCMNSFFMAYKQLNSKIKHTKALDIKVEDLVRSIEAIRLEETAHFETVKRMATAPADRQHLATVYATMFNGLTVADLLAQRADPKADILSTKMLNAVDRLDVSIRRELASKDKTLWGLFSGVTHYTTHVLGEGSAESKMFGSVATKERALFTQFAELVK